jgi:hypothetical protein
MAEPLVSFLSALGAKVFWFCAIAFIILNGAALAALLLTRSRRMVDAWTPRLVTMDALLLGAGLGVPLATGLARMGIEALASMLGSGPTANP